ncbi:MAG: uracil-DNA glycosylase family protein [Thermoplasmataceae archaeon]
MILYNVPENAFILFVGINPHPGSFSRGIPFSNNKNFWYNLSRAGLIDDPVEELKNDGYLRKVYSVDFPSVYRYGFMNLVDRPTVNTAGLLKGEELDGVARIHDAILTMKPRIVCFIGKVTYATFSGKKEFSIGLQDSRIHDSLVFVASFPIRGPNSTRVAEMAEIGRIIGRKGAETIHAGS